MKVIALLFAGLLTSCGLNHDFMANHFASVSDKELIHEYQFAERVYPYPGGGLRKKWVEDEMEKRGLAPWQRPKP